MNIKNKQIWAIIISCLVILTITGLSLTVKRQGQIESLKNNIRTLENENIRLKLRVTPPPPQIADDLATLKAERANLLRAWSEIHQQKNIPTAAPKLQGNE